MCTVVLSPKVMVFRDLSPACFYYQQEKKKKKKKKRDVETMEEAP